MNSPASSSKLGSAQPLGQGPGRLDSALCEELEKIVEEMTHSGRPALEEKPLKQLKKICRTSDAYVELAFQLLSSQLMEEHAEIRLSSFQIMNELFNRSHHFRELLVADMQEFLELTVETNGDNPLPPPKAAANLLKEQTLQAIQEWNTKYGKAYKKLALGYGFLKYNKMVDFANLEARTAAEQRALAARQAKMQLALAQRISKTLNDMDETIPEMNECLTQIENCFELLLPHPARYSDTALPAQPVESTAAGTRSAARGGQSTPGRGRKEKEKGGVRTAERTGSPGPVKDPSKDGSAARSAGEDDGDDDDGDNNSEEEVDGNNSPLRGKEDSLLQQHGLPSWNYNIDINVSTDGVTLEEDEDNQAILATLEDMNRLISSSYLPRLASWMEVFSKSGRHDNKVKRCLDLKQALQSAAAKYAELNVHADESKTDQRQSSVNNDGGRDSDSEGEGFEDVPEKEGYEPVIPDHLREEYGLDPLPSTSQESPHTSSKQDGQKGNLNPKAVPTKASTSTTDAQGVGVWHPLREAKHDLADPTSHAGTILAMKERLRAIRDMQRTGKRKLSSSPKEELTSAKRQRLQQLSKAPVVPFGVDLEHWTNPEKIEAPMVVLADTAQCMWSSSAPDEVKVMEAAKDSLTTRVFNYTGEFQPVKWACRAPMPSGKLCQRMDRRKCPFHGKIIPRDDQGNPEKVEDKMELVLTKEQEAKAKSLLADAELGRDIEAGLGLDLGGATSSGLNSKGGKKKGKGKAKKYPNLTDLKKKSNTAINRLEKKVLNKGALRRVANAMNRLEAKRYHDKFSNNFNYR